MFVKTPNPTAGTARSSFNKLLGLLPAALFAFTATPTQAALQPPAAGHSVNLAWDSIPEIGISGYRVYVGSESGQYSTTYEAGTSVSIAIGGLEHGSTYFFAVSGIGSGGLEGDVSSEIVVTIAPPPLPVGVRVSSRGASQPALQWTFPKSKIGSSPEFVVYSSEDLVNWTKIATIKASQSTGGDAESLEFVWPFDTTGGRKFFRITAQNWMGQSMSP